MQLDKPVLAVTMSSTLAVRNFFQTDIIRHLQGRFTVEVFAPPVIVQTLRKLGYDYSIGITSIDPGPEPWSWRILRQIKKKVYMEGRLSATEAIWAKFQLRPIYQRMGARCVQAILLFANAQRVYALLETLDLWINRDRRYLVLLRNKKVDLFFATHATVYWEECLFRNTTALGLPSIYMVLSWDHLSSKVMLHSTFSRILVWNEHTRDELLATYPSYKPDQIRVVGIPQYDPYADRPELSYAGWCRLYGLDPKKRTILFSTMPQVRHNQQHIIIEDLLKAIVSGRVPPDFQVLIKCHPFDNFSGYDTLLGAYPVGIRRTVLPAGMPIEHWQPSAQEIIESRDCLYFCAININIFSTVTIEAAWFDKPIIHIAYDPKPIEPGRIPCECYYQWEHFKHIVEKDAAIMVRSLEELIDAVQLYLADPGYKALGRRRVVQTYIGVELGGSAAKVANEVATFQVEQARHSPLTTHR